MKIYGAIIFILFFLASCDLFKSEDDKISEILTGSFYEDDTEEENVKMKDLFYDFYKDGKFQAKATAEMLDEYGLTSTEIKFNIYGRWSVKNKFIYYTYDKIISDPEIWSSLIEESVRKKNTPDKVVEYDDVKIVYEDSDGKRQTLKKTF